MASWTDVEWSRAEALSALAATIVALGGLFYQGALTRDQIEEGNADAWGYLGGEQCSNYRDQVLELWQLGSTVPQIISWFSAEKGSAQNPYTGREASKTSTEAGGHTAYDDLESGCGSVCDLLRALPRGKDVRDCGEAPQR